MNLSARRRHVELAEIRAQASAANYRQSAEYLRSRLHRDWRWPLAAGFGAGAMAGVIPLAATLRAGSVLLRWVISASRVPYGALSRLARKTHDDSSPD